MNEWLTTSAIAITLYLLLAIQALLSRQDRFDMAMLALWFATFACLAAGPFYNMAATGPMVRILQTVTYAGANLTVASTAYLSFIIFEERRPGMRIFWLPVLAAVFLDSYDFYISGFSNWPNDWLLIGLFEYTPQWVKLGYIALALYAVVRSWKNDLVPRRFWVRYIVFTIGVIIGLEMLLVENIWGLSHPLPYDASHFHTIWLTGLAFWLSLQYLTPITLDWRAFRGGTPARKPQPRMDMGPKLSALKKLMEEKEIFRNPELSISALSNKLAVPEHRIRELINSNLGYRNFNVFLNDYRIAAAVKAFENPGNDHLPILTVAMDVGFGSLAPFNKAFKDRKAMTPSEFRAFAGSKPSAPA